jgi:hypothetical protein
LNDVNEQALSRKELRTVKQKKHSILLDESCAQVHLERVSGDVEQRWYLDSSANKLYEVQQWLEGGDPWSRHRHLPMLE